MRTRLVDQGRGHALKRSGHAADTLVIYTGDHGYMLGQHGRFEKHCCYKPAVRSPLLLRQSLQVAADRPEFFERLFVLLEDAGRQETARRVLKRHVPEGPRSDALVKQWRAWSKENQPYCFFTDMGGYRWMSDPLAKKRAIPTAELQGPRTGDATWIESRSTR